MTTVASVHEVAVAADAVALPAPAARGRTTVSGRALRSVAAAAAARELGVAAGDVHVALDDDHGRLAVVVRAPVAVDPAGPDALGGDARPVLDRAEAARARVAAELAALGGAGVGSCRLVVTAVEVAAVRSRVDRRS